MQKLNPECKFLHCSFRSLYSVSYSSHLLSFNVSLNVISDHMIICFIYLHAFLLPIVHFILS